MNESCCSPGKLLSPLTGETALSVFCVWWDLAQLFQFEKSFELTGFVVECHAVELVGIMEPDYKYHNFDYIAVEPSA